MLAKIAPLYRQFEANLQESRGVSPESIQAYKASFYAGAYACAWRIAMHLKARGKDDAWMAELLAELDDAIHQQAAAEFAEPVQ